MRVCVCLSVTICVKNYKSNRHMCYTNRFVLIQGWFTQKKLEFQLSINSSQPRKTDFCPPDLNSMENSAEMYTYGREYIINVHFISDIAATCTRKPCKTLEI